jgi:hypothetical protein
MKRSQLCLMGLILLIFTHLAFANPTLIAKSVEQSLRILENLQTQKGYDEIKERQLIDLMGDMRGVINTLSEVSNFTEPPRQERIYENSLISLSQSLDKSHSLAKILLENRKIKAATHLISIYEQLVTLKKHVLVELNQAPVANRFQQQSDQKLSELKVAKTEAEKAVSAKTAAIAAGETVAVVGTIAIVAGPVGAVVYWVFSD